MPNLGTLFPLKGCTNCGLRKEWPKLVNPKMAIIPPEVKSDYRIVVLGDAPGESDDADGLPFMGATGKFLRESIPSQWRNKLYWANVVRCHPPKRPPTLEEQTCCSHYLERDLSEIKPDLIICVGDVALKYFWPEEHIAAVRGIPFPIELDNGHVCWCYSILHPSHVVRSAYSERFQKTAKRQADSPILPVFESDIRNIFELVSNGLPKPKIILPKPVIYPNTPEECFCVVTQMQGPIAIDYETFKLKPYQRDAKLLTTAYSDGNITCAVPVEWPSLLQAQWVGCYRRIMAWLKEHERAWIAHKAEFELIWTWYKTGTPDYIFEDTYALARLIHFRSSVLSLQAQTRIQLGYNIKAVTSLDRRNLLQYPLHTVLEYNALDSWSEAECFHKMDLPKIQYDNYQRMLNTTRSCVAMEMEGLEIDLEQSVALSKHFTKLSEAAEKKSREIPEVKQFEKDTKREFRISANQDVGKVLMEYCGVTLPHTKPTPNFPKGQPSTDSSILEPLLDTHPLINITLEYRGAEKLVSTYITPIINGTIIGVDGRIHPAYTSAYTNTGRLSSEDPNVQNWPKRKHSEIRRQVVPKKGHILAAFDYAQLEVRMLCCACGDQTLREYIIKKKDIHREWRDNIIDRYPAYYDQVSRTVDSKEEKIVLKAARDYVKGDFIFASFYGAVVNSVAARLGLPVVLVEEFHEQLWGQFPLIKQWHEARRQEYRDTGMIKTMTEYTRHEIMGGNEPLNTPIQGTGAHIVLEAQNACYFKSRAMDNKALLPRINIHDDLVFEFPDDETVETNISIVAKEIVKPRFPFIIVPLSTECRIGYNWTDLKEVVVFSGQYYENGILIGEELY